MTKSLLLSMLTLALLASPVIAINKESFQYSSDISGPIVSGNLYNITLTDEILKNCAINCRDLRVLGSEGNEIPYVILKDERYQKTETYTLETVNFEEDSGSVTLTLKMPQGSKRISVINLGIDGKDFKKSVSLSCSNDLGEWSPVAEGNIYDFSSQVDLRKTEISFGGRDCLYYRLRLVDDRPQAVLNESIKIRYKELEINLDEVRRGKLRIDRITAKSSEGNISRIYDRTEFDDLSNQVDENGNTVVVFEAGLPFSRMTLNVANPYFYRSAELYYSDTDVEGPYRFMTRSAIYRFSLSGTQETKTFIEYNSKNHRYYKIVIRNDDNPPLAIKGVVLQRVRENLFFVSLDDADKYGLYFGNPQLDRQNYDLSKFIRQNNWSENKFEVLKLSSVKKNTEYREPIDTDKQARVEKILLIMIVIGLVIAIGYWLYVLVSKTSRANV